MSASFTNQVLAQLELHANAETYGKSVTMLPKALDEEVARLHLGHLGVKLTTLSKEQADYIGVPVDGPYKPNHYRYSRRTRRSALQRAAEDDVEADLQVRSSMPGWPV
jgi:adenosylhomocysteinase